MRTIMIDGDEKVACPRCNHPFALSEGISKQTIERYAQDFERAAADQKKALERSLAAEAKKQFDIERQALREAVAAKDSALDKSRNHELELRRQVRALDEAKKGQELEYQRKLDD